MSSAATFTLADLARFLRESAGETEGINLDNMVIDTGFVELGYDSLALLQVIGRIEREYGVQIPDEFAQEAETPRALLEAIRHAQNGPA